MESVMKDDSHGFLSTCAISLALFSRVPVLNPYTYTRRNRRRLATPIRTAKTIKRLGKKFTTEQPLTTTLACRLTVCKRV